MQSLKALLLVVIFAVATTSSRIVLASPIGDYNTDSNEDDVQTSSTTTEDPASSSTPTDTQKIKGACEPYVQPSDMCTMMFVEEPPRYAFQNDTCYEVNANTFVNCGGGEKLFTKKHECEQQCLGVPPVKPFLPIAPTPCDVYQASSVCTMANWAYMPSKWAFDGSSCQEIIGNRYANCRTEAGTLYETQAECESKCPTIHHAFRPQPVDSKPRCESYKHADSCTLAIRFGPAKYGFDGSKCNEIEANTYGNCNTIAGELFESRQACEEACVTQGVDSAADVQRRQWKSFKTTFVQMLKWLQNNIENGAK